MKPHICNTNTSPVVNGCHYGYWMVKVETLKGIAPNRTHAYILPDDSVWALSHDETKMVLLRSPGSSYPTRINNTDNFLVVSDSGTYSVNIDVDVAKLTQLIHDEAPATDLTGLVKNPTWNGSTYTLVLPRVNGTSITIDLPVEQLIKGISFDSATKELVLTLDNGTRQRVPLNTLVVGLASETWVNQQLATLQASIKPTALSNTDNYLVVSGSGTYNVTANVNTTRFTQLIQSQLSGLVRETWVRDNAVMLTGSQSVAGTKEFSDTTVLARPQSSRTPTNDIDLTNKEYVDKMAIKRAEIHPPVAGSVAPGGAYSLALPQSIRVGRVVSAILYADGGEGGMVLTGFTFGGNVLHFRNVGHYTLTMNTDTYWFYISYMD